MSRSLRSAVLALGLAALSATGAFALGGDVTGDGTFDLRDPLALCRFLSGTSSSLPAAQNGDVNFDGVLSKADLDLMMQAMVGVPLPAPPLVVSPASLDFGDLDVGDELTLGFEIKNTGAIPATVNSIALGAPSSSAFSIVTRPPLPVSIVPGASVGVTVRYAPAMPGDDLGSVVSLGPGGALPVALKGHALAPLLAVSPASLSFGDVLVGNEALLDLQIRNDGTTALLVQSVAPAPGTGAEFSVAAAPPTPFSVVPGDHAVVTVRFAPASTGAASGGIDVVTNAGPANVPLTGRGVAPALDVAPTSLDFGNVLAGDSQSRSFSITNAGSAPLDVTGVGLQLGSSADFHLAPLPPTPFTIAAGDSRMVDVGYMPSGVGTDAGKVEIHTSAGDAFVDLVGAGVAPAIDVVPQSLDFMNVLVGQTSALPVEIVNSGSADLTLSQIVLLAPGGGPPADFALQGVPALPVAIAPGMSLMVDVVYAPGQVGGDTATLRIVSNDPSAPMVDVPVTGNGVQPGVMVHPTSLLFSNVRAGRFVDLDFEISNSGGLDLTVTALAIDPNSSPDFTLVAPPQLPIVLHAGDAQTLTVRYAPPGAGTDGGKVLIDSSAGAAQIDLSGSAIAPKIRVAPATVAFGNVLAGQQSTVDVTIANDGSDTLNVSSIGLSGSADITLAMPPTPPLALAPGDTVTLHAVYAPSDVGHDASILTIDSDDPGAPTVTVALAGDGVAPHLTVSPVSIDFGDVSLGFARTRQIRLSNTGTGDLLLFAPSFGAGSSAAFAFASQPQLTIAAGGSTTFDVTYTPSQIGGDAGSVEITGNGGGVSIPLAGNGVTGATVASIALTPVSFPLEVGGCVQLRAVALLTNATTFDVTTTGAWSALDPGIAAVGTTGLVTGIAPGLSSVAIDFAGAHAETDVSVFAAGTLRLSTPCGDVAAGSVVTSELTLKTGALPLGSYAIRVHFDPAIVKIRSIEGGLTSEFSAAPSFDPSTFASGATILAAFQNASLTSPAGDLSLARISFEVIGAGGSAGLVSLEAITLSSTGLTDIPWTNVPAFITVAP